MCKFYSMHALDFKHEIVHVYWEVLASVVLGECEKVSRTENILLPKKKVLFVGILNMLIIKCLSLPITHRCFVGLFCICIVQ